MSFPSIKVERRFDLGGSLAHEALVAGEIDTYVEYTGTALLAILKSRPSVSAGSLSPRQIRIWQPV
jgi:osmoprotectant transport system substrate-binding protein